MSSTIASPDVDVIIAVHQLNRPIRRAVSSVLAAAAPGQARAIVIAHGLDADDVRSLLQGLPQERVQVVEHVDGVRSAAGPFNAGLRRADAEFVAVMGSDDMLEPGALSGWVNLARQRRADVVLAPLKLQSGPIVRTPRLRPLRRHRLDPIRDRLAYRTAPLGLLRLSTIRGRGLAFMEGMPTGEDVSFSLNLWFGGSHIVMGPANGHYVIGEDAVERVTHAKFALDDEFSPFLELLGEPWLQALPVGERTAIAVKIARIHVLTAMTVRGAHWEWGGTDGLALQQILGRLQDVAPGFEAAFSRADRRLLGAALVATEGGLGDALEEFLHASYRDRLLTENVADNFLVESNLRYYLELKVGALLRRWMPKLAAEI
ncbi:glycosyltransferase [Specibacter sp. RAF43]|uniref:glycosyltransferase n=1 Tax=Specibacter sp. RAF43 TaxID=3233057 RepID=UPI003F99CE66